MTVGMTSCTAYVEDTGYAARPSGAYNYRGGPRHGHGPYYGSRQYNQGQPVIYNRSRSTPYRHGPSRRHPHNDGVNVTVGVPRYR